MKKAGQNKPIPKRASGILLPVFSLPSPYGIGTFGECAYRFVDFLAAAGQRYWQVLPIGPTSFGDSPYQSFSTFAGNPYFIDLDLLVKDGLLTQEECDSAEWGGDAHSVDYALLYQNRFALLQAAFWRGYERDRAAVDAFIADNRRWIHDYALFMALKDHFEGAPWFLWDKDIRVRDAAALKKYRALLSKEISYWSYLQYLFFSQWGALKAYANRQGVSIIGDIPFYVAADSADVWANAELFDLDKALRPRAVAGVPPDYFSKTGQLWGNPLYRWKTHEQEDFSWWVSRIGAAIKMYDLVRIDHFRGFASYYTVLRGEETAERGKWKKGPGMPLFAQAEKKLGPLPIIAEDLGILTPDVEELLKISGFPGMRVLQFAFNEDWDNMHLPHNYISHCVAYTGTHDNDTVAGWWESANETDKQHASDYLRLTQEEGIHWGMIRGVWASVADLAIAPMQDFLGLGTQARVNEPSTIGENWRYRISPEDLTPQLAEQIERLSGLYQRSAKTV